MFIHQDDLNVHTRLHREERPFQCQECQQSFHSKQSFNYHNKSFHSNPEKNRTNYGFACSHGCQRIYKKKKNYLQHHHKYFVDCYHERKAMKAENNELKEEL